MPRDLRAQLAPLLPIAARCILLAVTVFQRVQLFRLLRARLLQGLLRMPQSHRVRAPLRHLTGEPCILRSLAARCLCCIQLFRLHVGEGLLCLR